jgi:hypothetical protein
MSPRRIPTQRRSAETEATTATASTTPDNQGAAPRMRRTRSRAVPTPPLGSLTQREHRTDSTCSWCGSSRVTRLTMELTDGTPVTFTSCHRCEHRSWEHGGDALSVDNVLDRTRRTPV